MVKVLGNIKLCLDRGAFRLGIYIGPNKVLEEANWTLFSLYATNFDPGVSQTMLA